MFLQRLEIHGFKSFMDRTEIRFGSGITAIVGPNGCGKTNITDAIRWVLGEQSAKQLRGDSMEDVIFGGSLRRKPVGMAEVTLTLENDRGALPTEYSEVQIGRRVFRSGNSEYSLNKTGVRLRDIRDLFYGTGMGSHAYSVIERSMVDHVLSDASGHRRFLFEEAAGITKYKQRKREAINKLNATDGDLLRVNDIVAELDRELGSLARQVAKTRRADRLRNEIRDLDLRLSAESHRESFNRERELGVRLEQESMRREKAAAELAAREAALIDEKTRLIGVENELSKSRQELAEAESRRTRAEHEDAVLSERVQGLERQIAEIEDDRKRLESRIESLTATERDLRERTDKFAAEAAGAKETAGREEQELARIEGELAGKRIVAEECKTRALELMKGESERKAEWEGARERLAAAAGRHLSARGMVEEIERRVASLEGEFSTLHEEKERLAGRLREVTGSLDAARSASEEADRKLNEATDLETERREKLTRLRTRIETLDDLKESMEGLDEGVKLILQEPERSGARGVVADFLDVDSGALDAVEALIGPLLGAAVVEGEQEADAALGLLSERAAGHASIVVLGRGRGAQSLRTLKPGEKGIAGWVRESVRVADGADGLIEVLVGDAVLVETPEDAVRLSAAYPGHRFVSRSGVVWNGGVVSGGRPSDADRGLLRRGQELKGLLAKRDSAESGFAEAGERKLEWVRRRDERAKQLEKIEGERGQLAETLRAQETRLEGVDKQLRANREELDTRQTEANSSEAEEKTLSASLAQAETDLSQLSQEASDSSRKLGQLEEEVRTLEHSRQELASRTNRVRDEWMEISSRHAEASADLARVEAELRELREAVSARVREVEQARERQRQTSDEHQALTSTLAERRSEEKTLREAAEGAVERTKVARQSLENEDKTVAESRLKLNELNEYVHHIEVERITLRGDLEKTLERLRVEYGVNLLEFRPEPLPEGQVWDPAAATERLEHCRERYGSLGPVNDLALDEYNTKKERHDFLTTQRDDLNKAKGQLLEAIEKINTTASELFEETFHKVEKNFQETFRTLFDGGECALRRVGDDPLECEIEIAARPRGKSLQSILLLSGGERALTAIALLFAIYLVKPSPFCILDEVDAPLDDANIDRFVRMLQRFSDRTQFIVVTHNKKTMEIAESLYGVTMQEPGVSRLVSVRFDKAENGNGQAVTEAAETNGVSRVPRAVTVRTEENGGRKVKTEPAPVVSESEPEVTLAGSPGNGKE